MIEPQRSCDEFAGGRFFDIRVKVGRDHPYISVYTYTTIYDHPRPDIGAIRGLTTASATLTFRPNLRLIAMRSSRGRWGAIFAISDAIIRIY